MKVKEYYLAKGEEGQKRLEAWQEEMDSLNGINSKEKENEQPRKAFTPRHKSELNIRELV